MADPINPLFTNEELIAHLLHIHDRMAYLFTISKWLLWVLLLFVVAVMFNNYAGIMPR